MNKINICDESIIIVEGSTEFGQISNHFCDRVEIHGAGWQATSGEEWDLKTIEIAETKYVLAVQ